MSSIDTRTKQAGVIGWPIAHSLSPIIHTHWASQEKLNASYIKIPVEPNYTAFETALTKLRDEGFSGVNVTLPHKEHALRYCNQASDAALEAGAANMVSFLEEKTIADNSDIYGFTEGLKAVLPKRAKKNKALILGAGGAARGIYIALKNLGYDEIIIANRTREKAEELSAIFGGTAGDWDERNSHLRDCNIVVNTTSLGMKGQPALEINLGNLSEDSVVSDIVYTPINTPLLSQAKRRNLITMEGLSMLIYQAIPGYQAWLGNNTPINNDLYTKLIQALNNQAQT